MKGLYGQYIRISRGKNHDDLGIILDFSLQGQEAVIMLNYLKWII